MVEPDIYHKFLLNTGSLAPVPSVAPGSGLNPVHPPAHGKFSSLPLEDRQRLLENPTIRAYLDDYEGLYELAMQALNCVQRVEGVATKLSKQ